MRFLKYFILFSVNGFVKILKISTLPLQIHFRGLVLHVCFLLLLQLSATQFFLRVLVEMLIDFNTVYIFSKYKLLYFCGKLGHAFQAIFSINITSSFKKNRSHTGLVPISFFLSNSLTLRNQVNFLFFFQKSLRLKSNLNTC